MELLFSSIVTAAGAAADGPSDASCKLNDARGADPVSPAEINLYAMKATTVELNGAAWQTDGQTDG